MADKPDGHWMEKAFANAHGQLRKSTGTKAGKDISSRKLNRAAKSGNVKTKRRAVLARTARKINSRKSR